MGLQVGPAQWSLAQIENDVRVVRPDQLGKLLVPALDSARDGSGQRGYDGLARLAQVKLIREAPAGRAGGRQGIGDNYFNSPGAAWRTAASVRIP